MQIRFVFASTLVLCLMGGLLSAIAQEPSSQRIRPLPDSEWSPEIQRMLGGTRDRVAALEGQTPRENSAEAPKTLNILRINK